MGCGICLEAYTADERPAALPCGHVFHAPCIHDWLSSRSHGALPAGCPLCKAAASPSSVLPLWPADANDFHQYVAVHSQSPEDDAHYQLLLSVRDLVFAIQSYAMAAHGLRSSAMARAASAAQLAVQRGAIDNKLAASNLQDAMTALHGAIAQAEAVSRHLARTQSSLAERARRINTQEVRHFEERAIVDAAKRKLHKERALWKQKQKHILEAKADMDAQAAALRERESALHTEKTSYMARAQESIAQAKSASAEAIRRAALAEEAAQQRAALAEERVRRAEECAADATEALEETRRRNQHLADQLRELQRARAESRAKRKADKARLDQVCTQLRALERSIPDTQRTPLAECPQPSDGSSSPVREIPPAAPTVPLLDDLDDVAYPMPGSHIPRSTKPSVRAQRTLDLWHHGKTVALGPRRRVR
ncbi:hypothetical protein MNAN1_003687 [Malassezia nana]|uniref:RING-type domain-containing protein n=1 Tax=Malassezia nana TaxID=180528 RepID=A0AAF0J4B4_9BASI|nr:hypothetical protein MNAN1_003687 [Malassezia nana]